MRLISAVFALWCASMAAVAGAQDDRKPQVDIISVGSALLTQAGVSVGETEVVYRIEFVPKNATRAEIQLLRDRKVVRSFPATLRAGVNRVSLPSGLQMENPVDYVTAQVTLADGKLSAPSVVVLHERADFERRDRETKARYQRLEPDLLVGGRGTTIKLFGTDLAAHVGRMTVNDIDVEARVVGGVLHLQVPAEVFRLPGFATVQRRRDIMDTPIDASQRLYIAIADPALPSPGGLDSPRIDAVEYEGNEYAERLHIRGFGFRRNQQIVIGRGRTPIQAQEAEMHDQKVVTTYLPDAPPANDYFIAVLSADKRSMTRPFPIPSPERMRAAAKSKRSASVDEPSLTAPGFRVFGDLAWNADAPQWLMLEGPIAKPGLRVTLKREGPPVVVEAVNAGAAAPRGKHPLVRVPVPVELTRKASFNVQVVIHTK